MRLFGTRTEPETCGPTSPRRDVGINGATAKDGYRIRKKFLGKLHRAALSGDCRKIQWLLLAKGKDINKVDDLNRTALHLACAAGYPDVVSFLVERHCKLDICDSNHRTPLMKAVQCQQEECVSILLLHGADPNMVDESSSSALHYAAAGENLRIVERLLESKANMEARDKLGLTPLLLAVKNHHEAMVDLFLKNGANVNAKDNSKRTALMMAISNKFNPTSLVQLILQYDVDLSCEDDFGWTIRDYVRISSVRGHQELVLQYVKTKANELFPEVKTSSPERASDIGFTLGRPALDKNVDEKRSIVKREFRESLGHNQSDNEKDVTDSLPVHPLPGTFSMPVQKISAPLDINKEELMDTEEEPKNDGMLMVNNATREQRHGETPNSPSELGAHSMSQKCAVRKDLMSAFTGGEEEDAESPWDSERVFENLPPKSIRQKSVVTKSIRKEVISSGHIKDYHQKYHELQLSQPNVERKDCFTNQETKNGVKKKQKSDPGHRVVRNPGVSPKWWAFSKPEVSPMIISLPMDTIAHGHEQRLRPVLSNWECPSTSQKNMTSSRSKLTHFHGNHPCESMALTQRQSRSLGAGPFPLQKDEITIHVTETGSPPGFGFVTPVRITVAQRHLDPPRPLTKEESEKDATQKLDFKGSSEESQKGFDKNHQEQVEEQKNKPQHNEMETLVEDIEEKLPEDKMTEKVNKWAFNVKSLQSNRSEENKIPGEEIPKMIVSSSNGSSVPLHHQSMWFPLGIEEEKQLKADMPLKTIREQIRKKEKLSNKDMERKRSLEPPIEAWAIEPRPGGNNLTQEEEQNNKPRQNEMETLVEYIGKTLPEDEMTVKDNELEFNVWNHHSNKRVENKITETETPKMTVSYSKESSIPVYHQSVFFPMRKEKEKQLRTGMTLKEIREQRKRREKLYRNYMEAMQSWEVDEQSWSREPKPGGNNLTQNLRAVEETPKMTISSSKESSISEYHRFMWFLLRKEEKKQPEADMPLKTIREQIRREEKLSSKEVEKKQSLEVAEQNQAREPRPGGNNLTQVKEEKNKPKHNEMDTPLDGFGEKLPEDNMTVNFNKLPFNVKDHHGNESEENKIPVEETPKLTVPSSKDSSIPVLHRFIRFPLKKEKEKQSRAGMPLKTIREQIRRKEKLSSKEVEKKQSLEEPEQSQTTKLRLGENNLTQVEEQKNKPQHSEMEIPVEEIAEKLPEDNMTVNFNKLPFDVEDHHGNEIEENKIPVEVTPKMTLSSSKESSIPVLHRFLWFPLKKEEKKQSKAGMPLKTIREQIRRKEKLSSKEVEKKQSLEVAEQSRAREPRQGGNNLTQVEEQKNKPQHNEMETLVEEIAEKLPEDKMTVNFNKLSFNVKDHYGNESEENKIPVKETQQMTVPSSKESSIPVHHRFMWFPLKKEEEKQSKAGMPLKTIREQIGRKEKLSSKDVRKKQSLEVAEQSRAREPGPGGHNLKQVEEQKKKPPHCEIQIPEEEFGENLTEDKMSVKVNELAFNVKNHQCNKSEENKIPGEEIPKMTISSSKESSVSGQHFLKWFPLGKKKEKQPKAGMFFKTIREHLRRKEKLYSEGVEMKQSYQLTVQSLDREPRPGGNNLKQIDEERYETLGQNDRALQDGLLSNHLRKQNEIEATALEVNQMCEIPDYHEKEKPVLQKNNLLLDEIGVFLLAGDTGKIEKREKESRHIKENEVSKEKIDELQKKLKLSEETLRTKLSEANKQLNFLMIKNRKLTSKWKKEKQKRARVGKDKQSCHLCSAIPDPKQCQTSKQDLGYAFQQERDEWLRIKDQLNYDLSRERDRNDFLAQQLEEANSEVNSLQNQLIHLHYSYREKVLILESTERSLHQAQFHIKELKRINNIQNEKQHEYTAKEECFQGKLPEIHSENMVLQQQLENAPKRVIIKKKVVKDVQVNFSDPFAKVHADREKQVLLVKERNKELIDDCNHSREQGCTYEKEQKEREGTIKELQQQLADALKRQSTLEAFLEVIFCYIHDLEDKKQQLQKETEEIKSKLRESEGRHPKAEPWTNDLEDGEQKLEMENGRLEATAKELLGKMEEMEENLLDPKWLDPERGKGKTLVELKQSLVASLDDQRKRNEEVEQDIGRPRKKKLEEDDKGDLASQEALKQACSQVEDAQMNTLRNQKEELAQQVEAASSKCIQLEWTIQGLRQELLSKESLEEKNGKLEKEKSQLEEEIANLKHRFEMTMLEHRQVEQYKSEVDEQATQEIIGKLRTIKLFLQTQAAFQNNTEQLRENHQAPRVNEMEWRMKYMEAELSTLKSSYQDAEEQLEKHRQLYFKELKANESLSKELDRANRRLLKVSAKLRNERQRNETLRASFTASPVLEPPPTEPPNSSSLLNGGLIPRGNRTCFWNHSVFEQ